MPSLFQFSFLTTCSRNCQENYDMKVIENHLKYSEDKTLRLQLPKSVSIIDYISYHNAIQKR